MLNINQSIQMMQGAEFEYPLQSTTEMEMKAACVGSEQHFVWYHLGFSARRRDNQEMHRFFAELCYHVRSRKITVETCTILGRYLIFLFTFFAIVLDINRSNISDSLSLYLNMYSCPQKSRCAVLEVGAHGVPMNPRFCTQATMNLHVERRNAK